MRAAGKQICNWQSGIAKFETCNLVDHLNDRFESASRIANLDSNQQFNLAVNQILISCFDVVLAVALLDNHTITTNWCTPSFLLFDSNENHCPRIWFLQPGPRNNKRDSSRCLCSLHLPTEWQHEDRNTHPSNAKSNLAIWSSCDIAFKFVGNDENSLLHFASVALNHIKGSDDESETNTIAPLEYCWSGYSCLKPSWILTKQISHMQPEVAWQALTVWI